jgi:glucokinase
VTSPQRYRRCLAIDVGGTKLAAAVVDSAGALHERAQIATPADGIFEALRTLVEPLVGADPRPEVIGVGCGGPMAGDLVSPLNIPGWRDFPLRHRLSEGYGLPVFVDNDAKALALGEGWKGAAQGVDNYLAMVVSTGVGGGIVLDGRLLDGELGNAGHIGHVIVEPGGRLCGCGARGCLEAECSGLHIEKVTGRPAAEASDEVRERTGRLVGRAVASVCNLLDLKLACIAGSVALGYGEPFFRAAQAEVDACARLEFSRGAMVRPSALGGDGPLIGAAAVGFSR